MGETNHHLNICFSLELGLIFQSLGLRDRLFFIGGGGMGEETRNFSHCSKEGGPLLLRGALKF